MLHVVQDLICTMTMLRQNRRNEIVHIMGPYSHAYSIVHRKCSNQIFRRFVPIHFGIVLQHCCEIIFAIGVIFQIDTKTPQTPDNLLTWPPFQALQSEFWYHFEFKTFGSKIMWPPRAFVYGAKKYTFQTQILPFTSENVLVFLILFGVHTIYFESDGSI